MIIVSDMELRGHRGGHGRRGPGGAMDAMVRGAGKSPRPGRAHLNPGMSSRLVIPVQLMSKVWGGGRGQRRGPDPADPARGGAHD